MQPGGKPEPGETPLQAVVREVYEELGVKFAPEAFENQGQWHGLAANEDETSIHAHLFGAKFNGFPKPLAEIEELLWIDPITALSRDDLAPLLREEVLPSAIARANGITS